MSTYEDLKTQAADWLARLESGTAQPEAFELWRDSDPRHAVAFAEALAAWQALDALKDPQSPPQEPAVPAPPALAMSRRRFLRAAVVIGPVLALAGAGAVLLRDDRAHASTRVGEMRRLEAGRGLTLELNTDSRVAWKSRDRSFDVWLEQGEAALFIDPASVDGVTLRLGEVEAVLSPGAYAVRALDRSTDMLVLAGDARMLDRDGVRKTARAGERLRVAPGERIVAETASDLGAVTAWRRGEIIFAGEPLSEAVAEYNRYLERKMVIADPEVAALRIGGRFETVRPDNFLQALATGFDLTVRHQGDATVIEKKRQG